MSIKENVNSGRRHEENETKLKDIISKQQNEMKEQEVKFTEATHPDFDAFTVIEKSMKEKVVLIGEVLKRHCPK